mgnify:CR=1 FL=1
MYNYILISTEDNSVKFADSLRDIERQIGIDHSYLSKVIAKSDSNKPTILKKRKILIYKIVNQPLEDKTIKYHYFVYNHENKEYQFYDSLRQIERKINIDHSSLSKLLNNKKYKTLGGSNPGRPIDNSLGVKGYNIYRIFK